MKRDSGFTTFTVTLLLIVILVGISLLVGKLMVTDRKVSVNEVQYRQALALAELGIADGLGRLKADAAWRTTTAVPGSAAQGTYLLSAVDSPSIITVGTAPNTKDVTPVILRAEATLADGMGRAQVQVQVAGYSLMTDAKAVPLMAGKGVDKKLNGTFGMLANPNGGGPGVPLSVWSGGEVPINGAFDTRLPDGTVLSDKKNPGPDIKGDDSSFPTDLLSYMFGEPDTPTGWQNMYDKAVAIPPSSSCNSLNGASTGIYIVQGACSLPSTTGSATAPVVLIVKDGSLPNKIGTFYGIIFAYRSPGSTNTSGISIEGGTLNGALIANYPIEKINGNFDLNYNENVISNIQTGASFQATKMVPGSWRDW